MALGVVGHVNQKSANGRRQLAFSHRARFLELRRAKCADARRDLFERSAEFGEERRAGGSFLEFASQRGRLFLRERTPFRVGEQAIRAPDDVPQVKSHRHDPQRTRVQLLVRKMAAPALDVFAG